MALVKENTALALRGVKTGICLSWNWGNCDSGTRYGIIQEQPRAKPGESLHCRPVGSDACFELFERVWYTTSREHPTIALMARHQIDGGR